MLGLSGNPLGDAGLQHLTRAIAEDRDDEVLPKLTELHLRAIGLSGDITPIAELAGALMPTRRGLAALRTLVLDAEYAGPLPHQPWTPPHHP